MAGDFAEVADGLDGCSGCLHGLHCLPVAVLMVGVPAMLIWML